MKHIKFLIFIAFAVTFSLSGFAQTNLTLEMIYKQRSPIATQALTGVKWLKDGNGYSRLESNPETGGVDIIRYDAATGDKSVMISATQLIVRESGKPLPVSDYFWSADNKKMLIFTNTQRVWRYHTRGDYWVLNLEEGSLRQLGKKLPTSSLMFAKFSPDDTKAAYVSGNNIYVENLSNGNVTQITFDGDKDIVNGTFDWVYEEEFGCRDGFRWSPDSKHIAFWRSDTRGTGIFYMINNIDSIYSKIISLPYPKVGTTNSAVQVGVIPITGGATQWIPIPGDQRNNYLPRMEFIPNSNELMIQQMNRAQNTNKIWIAQVGSQKLENIFTDTDEAWLDVKDNIYWINNETYFTWIGELDGWRHLFLISRDGKTVKPITKGNFDVENVAGIDMDAGYIYFISTLENYTQRDLYRAKIIGDGSVELVSPAYQKGQHRYNMSPTGRWAIHTFSSDQTPPVVDMVSLPAYNSQRILIDNSEIKKIFDIMGLQYREFVKVDIGEIVLDAWILKPIDFNPAKQYPVIVSVYGEPAGSTVQDSWSPDLFNQYLLQQGYMIVSIENRGANVPRGREWRKSIYQKIGIINASDQAKAIVALGKMFPYFDMSRVGITGWSGGGSSTLNALFQYPDVYHTGIAVAAVPDQKLYNTIYQERYMGHPDTSPDGFRDGSPITHAAGLKGNLLIVHGTGDDNVHYQGFELVVDELVRHGKFFTMLSYPMRSHGINERENTTFHLRMSMAKYWKDNLPAGGR
ncbi:MAG: S9 family peptidase [Bacteroidales bacterium]|nr:S9 family peptidase [Bacteroidales bacterium]